MLCRVARSCRMISTSERGERGERNDLAQSLSPRLSTMCLTGRIPVLILQGCTRSCDPRARFPYRSERPDSGGPRRSRIRYVGHELWSRVVGPAPDLGAVVQRDHAGIRWVRIRARVSLRNPSGSPAAPRQRRSSRERRLLGGLSPGRAAPSRSLGMYRVSPAAWW